MLVKSMIKFWILLSILFVLINCGGMEESAYLKEFPDLSGEYLGQTPPGTEAAIFATGIVSTGMYARDVAMMPDGSEIYFCISEWGRAFIFFSKNENGKWTEPEIAPFSGKYLDFEPFISPDGQKLFFLSNRPEEGEDAMPGWRKQDIWAVDRTGTGWGEPYNPGEPVNTDNAEFYPAVTSDNTLYFTRVAAGKAAVYRSRFVDGKYDEPVKISDKVNTDNGPYNAYISPDESYLIFCYGGREDGFGGADYYISFRDNNDNWSDPVNMGEKINNDRNATSAYVSPDGKYLFFGSSERTVHEDYTGRPVKISDLKKFQNSPRNGNSAICWIDAGIIEELRNNAPSNR
ncbi:MAG: hypothetical protein GY863_10865 [bacterium]|nr:hypothetical protein [bacterium]